MNNGADISLANLKISETMGDYLGEMYRLGLGKTWISTTSLAENLYVSGPATVRMVHRLQKLDLVEHQPYHGVKLTPLGVKAALLNIRRHRLVERFLVEIMEYEWHEVHNKADKLQKGFDQELEDRIDMLMNYPNTCPHGDPIPTRDGVMPELNDKPLTVVATGAKGRITRIKERTPAKLQYLGEIGLVPEATFQLLNRSPFNGPLRLQIGRDEQIIGFDLAAGIWVNCDPK